MVPDGRTVERHAVKTRTIAHLYLHLLRDMYDAENHLAKALPKMVKAASNPELKDALKSHLLETKVQAERLEHIFTLLNIKTKTERCLAMDGLLAEAQEMVDKFENAITRDAAIIAACRKVEHYEMGSYETLIDMAKLLGHTEHVKIMRDILTEEREANGALIALANSDIYKKSLKMKDDTV